MEANHLTRRVEGTDQPFLWQALYLSLHVPTRCKPFPREVINQPEISRYVDRWGRDGDLGFIALDASTKEPIGAAWLRLLTASERGYGYVDDKTPELAMAVLPECRGLGVGTELLERLFEAASPSYERICLSVSTENPAIRLYDRVGFKRVRVDGSSVVMVKSLTDTKRI